jgi:septal ring factor EnvC (AmiA/AmiB activator)
VLDELKTQLAASKKKTRGALENELAASEKALAASEKALAASEKALAAIQTKLDDVMAQLAGRVCYFAALCVCVCWDLPLLVHPPRV